jgi:hypothetical protein
MEASQRPSVDHRSGIAEPPAVTYASGIRSDRRSRWPHWTVLGLASAALLFLVITWLDHHIYINPAQEYCTRCLSLSRMTHRTVFGCNWDGKRDVVETPVARVIQAHDGYPCTHQWRIYSGRPQTLLFVYVADYFPPYWLMTLKDDPDDLAGAPARRLRDDSSFLDELRAALPSGPRGEAQTLMESLTTSSAPTRYGRGP